jgi:hypothetical protein
MATFNTRSLQDIFGDVAQSQVDPYRQQRAIDRSKTIAGQAASGRLSSGIAEHTLGEFDRNTASGESAIRAGVLPSEAQGTLQEQQNEFTSNEAEKEYQRNLSLSKLLGEMNKPSSLSEIFGGIGAGANLIGNVGKAYSAFA